MLRREEGFAVATQKCSRRDDQFVPVLRDTPGARFYLGLIEMAQRLFVQILTSQLRCGMEVRNRALRNGQIAVTGKIDFNQRSRCQVFISECVDSPTRSERLIKLFPWQSEQLFVVRPLRRFATESGREVEQKRGENDRSSFNMVSSIRHGAEVQLTHATAELAAQALDVAALDVLVCSTGLIGMLNDRHTLLAGVSKAISAASADGGGDAASAIMTTDTVAKTAMVQGDGWSVAGMAKGAGMLAPGLATMLVFLTTDADVAGRGGRQRAACRDRGHVRPARLRRLHVHQRRGRPDGVGRQRCPA